MSNYKHSSFYPCSSDISQYGSVKIPPPAATPLKKGVKEGYKPPFLRGVGGISEE